MPFAPILQHISNQGAQIFSKTIPHTPVPSDEKLRKLNAIEDVLFIGYPAELYDQKNLISIVCREITATLVCLDFSGERQFFMDASVFPGSSGNSVLIYEPSGHLDKKAKATVIGSCIFLLGVLSAAFRMPDAVSTEKTLFVKINQLVDIRVVFKAEIIIETIQEFLEEIKKCVLRLIADIRKNLSIFPRLPSANSHAYKTLSGILLISFKNTQGYKVWL